ncbi:MAG: L,D-transpeptidase family protein, partial [Christensenellales bacterium]
MRIRRFIGAILALTIFIPGIPAFAASPYYITVDCLNNIVTVYSASDDSIVRQMICSSGTARYPTPRGTFTMPTKRRQGERGDWYTFEDGYG